MPSKAQRAATRKGAAFLLNFGFGFETRDLFQRKANASADMMSGKLAAFAPASDCYWVNLPALCELLWGKKGIELGVVMFHGDAKYSHGCPHDHSGCLFEKEIGKEQHSMATPNPRRMTGGLWRFKRYSFTASSEMVSSRPPRVKALPDPQSSTVQTKRSYTDY
jgi:hypothetical protein